MSIQEKKPLVSLVSNLLIFGIYYLLVFRKYNQSGFSSEEELRFWAAVILILVPVLIVAKIVLYILFSIVNTIVTKEQESMLTDELDNLIELKSTRNFYHAFMIGFFISMGALVLKLPITMMFVILLATIFVAGIVSDLSKFYFYRNGI